MKNKGMMSAISSLVKSVGLEKEDALNQTRWRVGAGEIAVRGG